MISRKKIKEIFTDELSIVVNDHSILLTVVIAPILYAFFLGSIYLNKDLDQIRFAVVDYDNTETTRELSRLLDASQKIDLVGYLEDYEDGVEKLQKLEIEGFLVFHKGVEREFKRMEGTNVKLYLNTTRFLPSNDLNMAVNTVMLTVGAGIRLNYYMIQNIDSPKAMQLIDPVSVQVNPIYNVINSYGGFLLPGLFFLILQQTLLIGLGESVSKDNENGKLRKFLSNSSNGVSNYFFGKTSYYQVLFVAYIILFTVVIFPFFQLPVDGSLFSMFIISIAFFWLVTVMAVLIGTFIKSQVRYMEIMAFTTYPFFLLSGYSWPISSMPLPLQWLSALLPTTPIMEAMTRLYVMGGSWADVEPQFFHIIYLLVGGYMLLMWRMFYLRKKGMARL